MKKLVSALFVATLMMSVSVFAGGTKTAKKEIIKTESMMFSKAIKTLDFLNENYVELGHYQNTDKLVALSEMYAEESELSFARAYRNETEIKLFLMKKKGGAILITTKVAKDAGPWCECEPDGVAYNPELGPYDPWQCRNHCDVYGGPGKN